MITPPSLGVAQVDYKIRNIGIEQGLANNSVTAIFKDSKGFMWFGTYDGLSRYDGYEFKNYRNIPGDSTSLINNRIVTICESEDLIWVGTKFGLCVYDYKTDKFRPCKYIDPEGKLNSVDFDINDVIEFQDKTVVSTGGRGLLIGNQEKLLQIQAITEEGETFNEFHAQYADFDADHNLWVFIQGLGLAKKSAGKSRLEIINKGTLSSHCMAFNGSGNIWMGMDRGVFKYNIASNQGQYLTQPALNHFVTDIQYIPQREEIWVTAGVKGIVVVDEKDNSISLIDKGADDTNFPSYSMEAMYWDEINNVWVGTLKGGISRVEFGNNSIRTISKENSRFAGLASDFILSFNEQKDGQIWIGTDGGGASLWNRKTNEFHTISASMGNTIGSDWVTRIVETDDGTWFATYGGGLTLQKEDESFLRYDLIDGYGNQQVDVWDLLVTRNGDLWVATITGNGLFKYNNSSDSFDFYSTGIDGVITLSESPDGSLYLGTFSQLIKMDLTSGDQTVIYVGFPVRDIIYLKDETLLVATEGKGLLHFNPKSGEKKFYTTENGLPNNSVLKIIQDDFGFFWLTTFNGLSKFDMRESSFTNYYSDDGLQSNQFNYNAALKLEDSSILVGGINGFNIIDPETKSDESTFPDVLITGIKVRNEPLKITYGNTVFDTKELELPYDESMLSFSFVGFEYRKPFKISYAYIMEGWDEEWHEVGDARVANYSKIEPGEYVFKVKSTDTQGNWNDEYTELKVKILPPWYLTLWAFLLYILGAMGLVVGTLLYQRERHNLKYDLKLSKELAKQNRELNEKKLTFFTNISHEFGTHLTMIVNPLKEVLYGENDQTDSVAIEAAYQNARRLLSLLDQLLLFRKIESETGELKIAKLDGIELSKEVYTCFIHQAKARNIQYEFRANVSDCVIYGDRQKLEMALFNIISNSLKFASKENGIVIVEIENQDENIILRVQDNGQGIPESERSKVFDLFYQTEVGGKPSKRGFGIGLYLVGKFVEMHKGEVNISDSSFEGAQIEIILKKGNNHFGDNVEMLVDEGEHSTLLEEMVVEESSEHKENSDISPDVSGQLIHSNQMVFIIDDNDQIRKYLRQILSSEYSVMEAASAEEALKILKTGSLPDLIISDVVMHEINGVELVRKVKEDDNWRHIPVVLLTSSKSDEIKLKGAEVGADDYISKPFDKGYLMARIRGILRRQKDIQDHLLSEVTKKPENNKLSEEDKMLLDNVMSLIEKRMTDEGFNIKLVAKEIGLSHSLLYKKIKQVTGKSVNEFIRFIRLRKVANLLITTDMQINEAVYKAGFSDLKYFRKQFQLQYGMNPSEFQKKYRNALKDKQYILNKSIFSKADA